MGPRAVQGVLPVDEVWMTCVSGVQNRWVTRHLVFAEPLCQPTQAFMQVTPQVIIA